MSKIYIKNGSIVLSRGILKRTPLTIHGARIINIGGRGRPPGKSIVIDAGGCFVAPGFIDTHIHGSPEKIFHNEIKHGTTAILVALSCSPLPEIYRKVAAVKAFMGSSPLGTNVLGVRLEGPYISGKKCGAQDARFIHKPDKRELVSIIKRCAPILKIVTIAPEIAGATQLIKTLRSNHIIASLGHSDATCEEAAAGIEAGITHATHLFNAMRGIGKTLPGAAAAILSDKRVTAEIIADMIHVHSARFILTAAVKRPDKMIMVTDSIAAEMPRGVWKKGGVYWVRKHVKAGSSLTMIGAIKNAVMAGGLCLPDAVRLVTLNPAKLLGIEKQKGTIAVGKDADLVVFGKDFKVKMTIVRGRIMYEKRSRVVRR